MQATTVDHLDRGTGPRFDHGAVRFSVDALNPDLAVDLTADQALQLGLELIASATEVARYTISISPTARFE